MPTTLRPSAELDPTDEDSEDYKQFYRFAWENIIAPGAKERTTDVLTDEMELGKWPGDEQTAQRIQGAKSVDDLSVITGDRRRTYDQLLKAREQEKSFRAQDPSLLQRFTQGVKELVLPSPAPPMPHELPMPAPSSTSSVPSISSATPLKNMNRRELESAERLLADTEDFWQQLDQAKNEMDETLQRVSAAAKGNREVIRHDPAVNRAYQKYSAALQRYRQSLAGAEKQYGISLSPRPSRSQ